MTVLSVAYPLMPVGVGLGGGAEEILSILDSALTKTGDQSIVIAASGSTVAGELIETPPAPGHITDAGRNRAQSVHRATIERVVRERHIDVIHFHGLDFDAYVPRTNRPMVATLHLPLAWYSCSAFENRDIKYVCVSNSQAKSSNNGPRPTVIPNGIEVNRYTPVYGKSDYLLTMSRICPEKGTDIALRVALRLSLPALVAGPVHQFSAHQDYFANAVQPLLDSERIYLGPVAHAKRNQLLANARCVLIPSLAPETSSLIAMEAAACGTPVIAYRSGALPEVVEDGITGFLVGSEDEMCRAAERIAEISPARCRQTAERRFSSNTMVSAYRNLYQRLISGSQCDA